MDKTKNVEMSGISWIDRWGKPKKDARKLIHAFAHDSDMCKIFKRTFPGSYSSVKTIMGLIEFDLGITVDVYVKKFDKVHTIYQNDLSFLNKTVEFAKFQFDNRDYLVYKILDFDNTYPVNLVEFNKNSSLDDLLVEARSFMVTMLGEDYGYTNYGDGWSKEYNDEREPERMDGNDFTVTMLALMEAHSIVSDNEYGVEFAPKKAI